MILKHYCCLQMENKLKLRDSLLGPHATEKRLQSLLHSVLLKPQKDKKIRAFSHTKGPYTRFTVCLTDPLNQVRGSSGAWRAYSHSAILASAKDGEGITLKDLWVYLLSNGANLYEIHERPIRFLKKKQNSFSRNTVNLVKGTRKVQTWMRLLDQ